jgi:hypothetical protein
VGHDLQSRRYVAVIIICYLIINCFK